MPNCAWCQKFIRDVKFRSVPDAWGPVQRNLLKGDSNVLHTSCYTHACNAVKGILNSKPLTRSTANAIGGLPEPVAKKPRKNPVDDLLAHAGDDVAIGEGISGGRSTRAVQLTDLNGTFNAPRPGLLASSNDKPDAGNIAQEQLQQHAQQEPARGSSLQLLDAPVTEGAPTGLEETPPVGPTAPTAITSRGNLDSHQIGNSGSDEAQVVYEPIPNISFDVQRGQYRAKYCFRGRDRFVGRYDTQILAARELAADYKIIISLLEDRILAASNRSCALSAELNSWSSRLDSLNCCIDRLAEAEEAGGQQEERQYERQRDGQKRADLAVRFAETERDAADECAAKLSISADLYRKAEQKLKEAGYSGDLQGLAKALANDDMNPFFLEILHNLVNGLTAKCPRYTDKFKEFIAYAQIQRCGTSCLEVLRTAGFPLPSESTNRRTIRGSSTSDSDWGISESSIIEFLKANSGCPYCILSVDGTDIAPELSEKRGPDGYLFCGDHCTEGLIPDEDESLSKQQEVFNRQMLPLDAFLDDPEGGINCYSMCHVLSAICDWLSGPFSQLALEDLSRAEQVVQSRIAKYTKTNAGKPLHQMQQLNLNRVKVVVKQLQEALNNSKIIVDLVSSLSKPHVVASVTFTATTSDASDASTSTTAAKVNFTGLLSPVEFSLWCGDVIDTAQRVREYLPGIHRAIRLAANSMLAIMITSFDNTSSQQIGAFTVGRKPANSLIVDMLRLTVDAVSNSTGGELMVFGIAADAEHWVLVDGLFDEGKPTTTRVVQQKAMQQAKEIVNHALNVNNRVNALALPLIFKEYQKVVHGIPFTRTPHIFGTRDPKKLLQNPEIINLSGQAVLLKKNPNFPSPADYGQIQRAPQRQRAPRPRKVQIQQQVTRVERPSWAKKSIEPPRCNKCTGCNAAPIKSECLLVAAYNATGTSSFEAALAAVKPCYSTARSSRDLSRLESINTMCSTVTINETVWVDVLEEAIEEEKEEEEAPLPVVPPSSLPTNTGAVAAEILDDRMDIDAEAAAASPDAASPDASPAADNDAAQSMEFMIENYLYGLEEAADFLTEMDLNVMDCELESNLEADFDDYLLEKKDSAPRSMHVSTRLVINAATSASVAKNPAHPVKTEFDVYGMKTSINDSTSQMLRAIRPLHVRTMIEQVVVELWMRAEANPYPGLSLESAAFGPHYVPEPEGVWATDAGRKLLEDAATLYECFINGQQHPTLDMKDIVPRLPRDAGIELVSAAAGWRGGSFFTYNQSKHLYTAFLICHTPTAIGIDVRTASKVMEGAIAQEIMDKELHRLEDEEGILFSQRFQCPNGFGIFMDEGHVLKNIMQSMQNSLKVRQGDVLDDEEEDMPAEPGAGAANNGIDNSGNENDQAAEVPDLGESDAAPHRVNGALKPAALKSVLDSKLLLGVLDDLITMYDKMPVSQQEQFTTKPHALKVILGGMTDKQNTSTARALFGSPEVIAACKQAGHPELAVCLNALLEGAIAWDMPGLTSAQRTTLLANRSATAWRILGPYPFLATPMPQSIRGISTKVLMRLISNADARLWTISQLPPNVRHHLAERALTSDPCELLFSTLVQLCGYKPSPERLRPALNTMRYGAAVKAKSTENRGYKIPGAKSEAWYDPSELQSVSGTWNNGSALDPDLAVIEAAARASYLRKHGKRAEKEAKPDKFVSLRTKAGFNKR